jgi:CHASE3 domain sensor protein
MQGKLAFVFGAAVGYVIGTRAGRQKYDRLKSQAKDLWEDPRVQRTVSDAETFAQVKLSEAGDAIGDASKKVAEKVGEVVNKHVATDSSSSDETGASADRDGKAGPAHA